MSHARGGPTFRLVFGDDGGAELLANGATVWASDADPKFVDEMGDDLLDADAELADEDVADVLNYLIDSGHMSEPQADACYIDFPEDEDEDDTAEETNTDEETIE